MWAKDTRIRKKLQNKRLKIGLFVSSSFLHLYMHLQALPVRAHRPEAPKLAFEPTVLAGFRAAGCRAWLARSHLAV